MVMDTPEDIEKRLSMDEERVLRAFLGDEDGTLEYSRLERYAGEDSTVAEEELGSTIHTLQANRLLSLEDGEVEKYSLTKTGEAYLEHEYGGELDEMKGNMQFYFDARNI
ncbi:MAG: hypothetical protein ABEJ75_03535 [Candidatus Nanohaloarchaea archaeon]